MRYRTPFLLPFVLAIATPAAHAQDAARSVNFIKETRVLDPQWQAELRQRNAWRAFSAAHPRWSVEFNEASGMPHRAYGPGLPTVGATDQERAIGFISSVLAPFGVSMDGLVALPDAPSGKNTFVHFAQQRAGIPVITGHVMVKLDAQHRAISFAANYYDVENTDLQPTILPSGAIGVAQDGVGGVTSAEDHGLKILPIPGERSVDARLVYEVMVHATHGGVPARYLCWVDAHSGELLYRADQVVSHDHGDGADAGADVQLNASVSSGGPLLPLTVEGLPDLRVNVGGSFMYTDDTGFLPSGVAGPVSATFELRGRWSRVVANGVTPSFTTTLQEGSNTLSFDADANVRQLSAYFGVSAIHNHVNAVLPTFTGMDNTLTTNVDLTTGDCNAFYDGSSINFYAEGNGCRSLALVPDVVYHEYGHGINDKFYQAMGSNFSNGGMNEGYADVWALTLSLNPILAAGYMLNDPNSSIRRYDIDPKVFPVDITGEVHADGEIIAGAWWDTYLLLGEDMPLTLQLFADAFPGLQAATFNGNEGPAFRDVLVDVLQADDDDGDITNGTPHGAEIVEAFAIHGITLLSNVTFSHTPVETAASEETIDISANVNITFPTSTFLSGVRAFYRLNNSTIWSSVLMTNTSGSTYAASIPAQPTGTVIGYYLALEDINGQTSSVDPIGAAQEDPNLPHFILVGMELQKTEDADMVHQLGTWTAGQPTDNATTGLWEQNVPVGSFGTPGDPSTMVQPNYQHTPGGDFCWVTGNATNESAALGENDVDGGTTTLISGNIDLTAYENPVFTYWRWYTNNPPSGANPNADWWQVYISGNGGSTWVPVEDTKSSDRSWRRNAFRVSDYVTPSAAVRLKFHASDSIRPGQNLDGGSLIEAAVDDIQLWELEENTIGIAELANAVDLNVHPDPANDRLNVTYSMGDRRPLRMEVLDLTGRTVLVPAMIAGAQRQVIDVGALTNGQYVLRLHWADGAASRRFSVVH